MIPKCSKVGLNMIYYPRKAQEVICMRPQRPIPEDRVNELMEFLKDVRDAQEYWLRRCAGIPPKDAEPTCPSKKKKNFSTSSSRSPSRDIFLLPRKFKRLSRRKLVILSTKQLFIGSCSATTGAKLCRVLSIPKMTLNR